MFINSKDSLAALLEKWQNTPAIALDTEFIRERTYFPQLCLVQVGIPVDDGVEVYAVDAIALAQYESLVAEALQDWRGRIIAHSFSQDVEILAPTPWLTQGTWFDTQVAASLLGWNLQVGYGQLVSEVLGVQLDKGASRTDWSQRPLSRRQLEYALDDVRYLHAIEDELSRRLVEVGRSAWVGEDSERNFISARTIMPNEDAYKKVKGFNGLTPEARKRARLLAQWREHRARTHDRPRAWVLKDEVILRLAEGESVESLVPAKIRPALSAAIQEADAANYVESDTRVFAGVPQDAEKQRSVEVKKHVLAKAQSLGIESNVLLTRIEMSQVARGEVPKRLQKGWRRGVMADELRPYLPQNGEV